MKGQIMSYCKKEGKDQIIFVSEDDHNTPSKVEFPADEEDDKPAGLVLPNGEINWACPCLGGMATGPCGVEFREAFTCFHHSKADPKGSDCLEIFRAMSTCMSYFPGVYGSRDDEEKTKDSLNNDNSNSQNETGSNSHNLSRIAKSNS